VKMARPHSPTVHLIEQVGRGGIFQHTLALGAVLASKGVKVRLHTAADSEVVPGNTPIDVCPCVEWFRNGGKLRKPLIASRYVLRTLPHLVTEVGRGDVVHAHRGDPAGREQPLRGGQRLRPVARRVRPLRSRPGGQQRQPPPERAGFVHEQDCSPGKRPRLT